MRNKLRITIAAVLASCALPLAAQDNANPGQMMLRAMDSNGDGSISLEEYSNADMPMMSRVDANNDGIVSEEEYLANLGGMGGMGGAMRQGGANGGQQLTDEQRAQMRQRMEEQARGRFAAMDTDGDKQIPLAEFRASQFNNMDQNKDGVLSGDELTMPGRGAMGGRGRNQ